MLLICGSSIFQIKPMNTLFQFSINKYRTHAFECGWLLTLPFGPSQMHPSPMTDRVKERKDQSYIILLSLVLYMK